MIRIQKCCPQKSSSKNKERIISLCIKTNKRNTPNDSCKYRRNCFHKRMQFTCAMPRERTKEEKKCPQPNTKKKILPHPPIYYSLMLYRHLSHKNILYKKYIIKKILPIGKNFFILIVR